MATKVILLLIGTFFLVHTSLGYRIHRREVSTAVEEPSDFENLLALRESVLKATEIDLLKYLSRINKKFSKIISHVLPPGKKLLQDVVDEISNLDNKDEKVIAKLQTYKKFLADDEMSLGEVDPFDFVKLNKLVELGKLLKESDTTSSETSKVDQIFNDSLRKHGLSQLIQEFNDRCDRNINNEIDIVIKALNTKTFDEVGAKDHLLNLLKNFKATQSMEEKGSIVTEFSGYTFGATINSILTNIIDMIKPLLNKIGIVIEDS